MCLLQRRPRAKGGWRRRHATQDIAAAVAKRAAKRKPRPCITAKGAGGRFIRNEDIGEPVRCGLKALDPSGEARALARAGCAAVLSEEAMARTRALRAAIGNARAMALLVGVARDIAAIEDAEARRSTAAATARRAEEERLTRLRQELARKIEAAVQSWDDEKARRRSGDPDA